MSKIRKFKLILILFIVFLCMSTNQVEASALNTITVENAHIEEIEENKYEYDVLLNQDQLATNITYTTNLDNYRVFGVGEQTLNVGEKHNISVIDEEGAISLYSLNVAAATEDLYYLESVSFEEFYFNWDGITHTYNIYVGNKINKVTPHVTPIENVTYEILDSLDILSGENKIRIKAINNENKKEVIYTFNIIKKDTVDFSEPKVHKFVVPTTGEYEIELWGAGLETGYGAYTRGRIELQMGEVLYFYVGGQGMKCTEEECTPGFNGGGASGCYGGECGYTGSGATDVRLIDGEWNDSASLRSRIMVAAGGSGGATGDIFTTWTFNSGDVFLGRSEISVSNVSIPVKANQIQGGQGGRYNMNYAGNGGFGYGGYGIPGPNTFYGGGGGGGYYGGGGAAASDKGGGSGGGGTSYVSGMTCFIGINEDGSPKVTSYDTSNSYARNLSYHYSGKHFTAIRSISGGGQYYYDPGSGSVRYQCNSSLSHANMPNPVGGTFEFAKGNPGNGYARITFALSDNNYLSGIDLSVGSLNEEFDKTKNNYTMNVGSDVNEITITGILEDEKAKIEGNGTYSIKQGENKITLTVTSESEKKKTYTITVTKTLNDDVTLKEVKNNHGSEVIKIEDDTKEYDYLINVQYKVVDISIEGIPNSTSSKVTGNGIYTLNVGNNDITLTVTSEAGTAKIYKVRVVRDDNNYLSGINLSAGSLNEEFDKTKNDYTMNVGNDVSEITIAGILEDENARVEGNGTYSIASGENRITLKVTGESGATNTYTVTITRTLNDDVTLKEVKNNRGSEVIKIEDDTKEYDYLINVQHEVPDIILEGIPNNTSSTVTGNGIYPLNVGNNDLILTVTSEAGTVKNYKVRIVRDLSANDDLIFLHVEEGGLNPHFNQTTIFYHVKVPNNVTEVHIEAIPEDKEATVNIVGDTTNLEVGVPREIQVVVTSPKGNQKTYTLSIIRQEMAAEDLALLKLETNRGELTPVFDSDTLNYILEVENEIKDITVTAEASSKTVQVIGTGTYDLRIGKNGISVFVIGEDEVQRDYQIVVTRKKSNDATLSSLVVKSHTLSPTFNKITENYTLKTSGTHLDFTTIKPTEEEATYIVSGNENFVTGENTVTIEVTAPDGETKKTYTLTVTKEGSKNNNLALLEVEGYTIVPKFHKGVTFYAVEVASHLSSVVIKAKAEDPNATITGAGLQKIETGDNTFEILVTSEAGTTKKYTVLVHKEKSDNNYLESLSVSEGTLDQPFDKETLDYEVTVPYAVDEITLSGTVEDKNATVVGFTNYNLKVGENNLTVTVTSESGLIRIYTVKITREELISAYLTNLEAKGYELDHPFDKELFEYNITVGNEVTELELSYTPEDKNATVNVTGNENFEVGMNEVHIKVTSSDGSLTEEYILYVNREISINNYLSSLSVDKGTLDPSFDSSTLTYNVEVDRNVEKINVSATTEDESATIVSGTGEHALDLGKNVIQVKVRSSSGITRTYTINVTRKMSDDNTLSDLKLYFGSDKRYYDINFNPETENYQIDLTTREQEAGVEVVLNDSNASVKGDGTTLLNAGTNTIKVIITSESGKEKAYTITIENPLSNNNYLSSLLPSEGTLNPSFDKETLIYTIEVESEINSLTLNAVKEDESATIIGDGTVGVGSGETIHNITVTAEDGTVRTYQITIKKTVESEARLEKLEILGYPFEFDPDTFEYHVQVSKSKKQLLESEVTAVPKDPEATVNLIGNLNLIDGVTNTYIVEVIAKDGYTTQEYKIHITRDSLEYTIRSNVYDINRGGEVEYVIGMDPKTKKTDFLPNFENDPETLHIYGSDGVEITEEEKFIGSYMTIKLEIDGYTYDELVITVRGDLNGDGLVTAADNVQAKTYILGKKQRTFLVTKIADINKDGLLTAPDVVRIKNYILGKRGLNE